MNSKMIIFIIFLGAGINLYSMTGFEFLKIETDAGIISRGGGIVENNFITAVSYNPALLGDIERAQIGFSYSRWFMDTSHTFAGIGMEGGRNYRFGISVIKFDGGEIEERDENGIKKGNYRNYDQSINLNFGVKGENYIAGVGVKYIESNISDIRAGGFGFDFGIVERLSVLPLDIGLSVLNAGRRIKYIEKREKLPTTLRLSFGVRAMSVFRIVGDVNYDVYNKTNEIRIGSEYGIGLSKVGSLYLRGGIYNLENIKEFGNFGGGVGFRARNINFDVGMINNRDLGNVTRITLNTFF